MCFERSVIQYNLEKKSGNKVKVINIKNTDLICFHKLQQITFSDILGNGLHGSNDAKGMLR